MSDVGVAYDEKLAHAKSFVERRVRIAYLFSRLRISQCRLAVRYEPQHLMRRIVGVRTSPATYKIPNIRDTRCVPYTA